MKQFLFFLTFFLSFFGFSQRRIYSDSEGRKLGREALNKIYNYDFNEAEKLIEQKIKPLYEFHPAYPLLKSFVYYHKSLPLLGDNPYKEEHLLSLQQTIEYADKMLDKDKNDLEATFFMMLGSSFLALFHADNGDYFKAMSEAKTTYSYIKKGFKLKEKNADFYLSSGLYHYYVVQYPENKPIVKPLMWFFPNGDKVKGLSWVKLGAQKGFFTKAEALMYLTHIELKYEESYSEAVKYGGQLSKLYPNNSFFLAQYAETLLFNKEYEKAKVELDKLQKSDQEFFQMAAYTLLGIYYEKGKNKYEIASSYYTKAQKIGERNTKYSYDYLGFCYAGYARIALVKSNKEKAKHWYEKTLDTSEYPSVKREAEQFLDNY